MPPDNVELVRRCYEVINAIGRTTGDFVDPEEIAPDLWARLDPDFELRERSDLPDARTYRGREESKEFWRKTQQIFAEIRWEPREFVDLGNAVVVTTRIVALGRAGEVPIEADEIDLFSFRDGLLVRLETFPSFEEAVRAAESAD